MRINLPAGTPINIIQRIRAVAHAEVLFNAHFPRSVSISTRNPSGIVNVSGKGSESVAAQRFFAWTVKEINNLNRSNPL